MIFRPPAVVLRACGRTHTLKGRPWLMGIVNATPDSFSDAGRHPTLAARVALAGELSLGAAISSSDWVSSHEKYGRNR